MANFTPTDEQLAALDMAKQGNSFKIIAYAGAGKTSTLKMISEQKKGRGLYLAFNKAIATDAQSKFPPNVRCQTFHSLAYRHVPRNITAKLQYKKPKAQDLANELKLAPLSVTRQGTTKSQTTLSPFMLAGIINEALSTFCKTAAAHPAPRHISVPAWVADADAKAVQEHLYPALVQYWEQSIHPRHPAGIGHDIYLKLWALSNPAIGADFVLFDEAQDADPLMMGVLYRQERQTIYVGDAHQQIYEWRGAVNAMSRLPLPDTRLTQSFRFGAPIADIANVFLTALQETTPLTGNPNTQSTVNPKTPISHKNAVLCRTNAAAIAELLSGLKRGHKVALQADSGRILRFCEGVDQLKVGKKSYLPELRAFDTWGQVLEFSESSFGGELKGLVKLVEEYGTPTITHALKRLAPAPNADYIVSTAHKAKGLEWDSVQIADDFMYDTNALSVKISTEELRLLYVACTRAKHLLDVHNIAPLLLGLKNKKLIYV